jgi:hypothetical protein
MDSLLIVITVVSSLVALAMSVVGWRVKQGEKRRAAARVAALAAAAAEPARLGEPVSARVEPIVVTHRPPSPRQEDTNVVEPTLRHEFLGGSAAVPTGTSHQRGLVAAAAIFAIGLTTFVAVRMSGSPAVAAPASPAAPLELLSLRHEREGGRLSVAGLVRNPAAGVSVERLTAVVLLFDQPGTFVTSSTAPVDFLRLGPGDESPFVVKLDAPPNVARYRVSFRTDNGTLAHVDRRGEPPLATPVSLGR